MNALIESLIRLNEEERLKENNNKIKIEESKTIDSLCDLSEMLQNLIFKIADRDYLLVEDENFFLNKQEEMAKAMQEIEERINEIKEDFEI